MEDEDRLIGATDNNVEKHYALRVTCCESGANVLAVLLDDTLESLHLVVVALRMDEMLHSLCTELLSLVTSQVCHDE